MAPFLLLLTGATGLVAAALLLLSFGEAFRVARLIQTTKRVSLEEAVALAERAGAEASGPYVRVTGRIDSDEAFPDEHRRPLVFRRTRLQVRMRRRWQTLDERRERVPFRLQAGLSAIGVHDDDLGDGLVVVPREAAGSAADVRDRLPSTVPATARARLRIDQVSAVDHATILGVPRLGGDGLPELVAGSGRPLVLTTLDDPEAMRILAGDAPHRPLAATGLLVAGAGLLTLGAAWLALRAAGVA